MGAAGNWRWPLDRWSVVGHTESLAYADWPTFDPEMPEDERREYVVQVNGKVRHRVLANAGLSATSLLETIKADPRVTELLQGKRIVEEFAVPGRLVNFVVSD